MNSLLYRYQFSEKVDLATTECALQVAAVAVEGLYGEARVKMDVG